MSSQSYYSGTESQQSISARSYYDNVDESKDKFLESSRFLMPPKVTLRNSLVNRSKSFQETAHGRFHTPRHWMRRDLKESSSFEDSFVDCTESSMPTPDVEYRLSAPPTCNYDDKKSNGPFYIKILRRIRKLSHQLRKCKSVPRGTSFSLN